MLFFLTLLVYTVPHIMVFGAVHYAACWFPLRVSKGNIWNADKNTFNL